MLNVSVTRCNVIDAFAKTLTVCVHLYRPLNHKKYFPEQRNPKEFQ